MWPFDRDNAQMYQQYAQSYDTGNYNNFNPGQIINQLSQFIQGAPPDLQQRVYQQHFGQLPYEQREFFARQAPPEYGINPNDPYSLSQGFMRMGQEQPGLLQRILGHPIMLGGAMALTGLVAKHMLNEHREREGYQQYENQQFGNQGYGYPNQGYPNQGFDPYQQQGGYQDPQLRRELARDEREIEHLERRERREEREEREEHRHRRREDEY
ncbi:hypothetical protein ccbrp13_54340 [Ktedonobacteria bacterium brp13]|nr:hypothetical protein ccbrp13_54340 [Ktedonobacteria bacterium brp13]